MRQIATRARAGLMGPAHVKKLDDPHVTSINGMTGAVSLTASDVGAAAASHTHANATTSASGFMSATDKSKLDGIEAGAQVNAVTSVAGRTGAVTLSASDISGLGNAATRNVGTTSGTVAAGDDSRITGALQRSGGTMTGALTLSGDPTSNLHAATKGYVDDNFVSSSHAQTLTPTQQAQVRENIGLEYAPRDILNPYAFGAAGDGVTDDGPALRAMFAQAGFIYIPKGVYRVMDGYIRLYSDTTVVMHPEAIIINDIQDTAWQKACLFVNGPQGGTADNGGYDNTKNIHFQGGTIDGSGRADRGLMSALFSIAHHDNISFRDMKIINPAGNTHAIELNSTRHGIVDNVVFDGFALNGATAGTREYINIDYSHAGGFPEFGPYDETICDDILIRNCVFLNGDVAVGSHASPPSGPHRNIRVEDCVIDGMISYGIDIRFWDLVHSRVDRTIIRNVPDFGEFRGSAFKVDGRYYCYVPDDAAVAIPFNVPIPAAGQQGLFLICGHSAQPQSPIGVYWANCDPGFVRMDEVAARPASTGVDTTTGPLSGTSGTDGRFTISAADDGNIYLENRRGGTLRVEVRFMNG